MQTQREQQVIELAAVLTSSGFIKTTREATSYARGVVRELEKVQRGIHSPDYLELCARAQAAGLH